MSHWPRWCGSTLHASMIQRATASLSASTSTICGAAGSSPSLRTSAKNPASHGPRAVTNPASPAGSCGRGTGTAASGGAPSAGVSKAHCGEPQEVIGSAPTAGPESAGCGRCTAWAWKLPQRPL